MTPRRRRANDCSGPEIVLVKHLARAGYSSERLKMLLVTAQEARKHISRPLVDFGHVSRGWRWRCHQWFIAGQTLQGATLQQALEHVTAAVCDWRSPPKTMQEYETAGRGARDRIANPEHYQRNAAVIIAAKRGRWLQRAVSGNMTLIQSFRFKRCRNGRSLRHAAYNFQYALTRPYSVLRHRPNAIR